MRGIRRRASFLRCLQLTKTFETRIINRLGKERSA